MFQNILVREFLGRIFLRQEFIYIFYITSVSQACLRFISGCSIEGKINVKIVWMSIQLLNKLFVTNRHFQEYKSVKCERS